MHNIDPVIVTSENDNKHTCEASSAGFLPGKFPPCIWFKDEAYAFHQRVTLNGELMGWMYASQDKKQMFVVND